MSAQHIYVSAPLGSIVRYSDGTPRPPARFKRKLAAWENNNSGGRLVKKTPSRDMPSCFLPASITLHQGDFGSAGVVVLRVYKTFSVNCALTFIVTEAPKPGSVRVLDREGEAAELSRRRPHRCGRMACGTSPSRRRAGRRHDGRGRRGCDRREGGMSTSPYPSSAKGQNPTPAGVTFGRTGEGLLIAKVGDNAFAMLPGSDGRFFLASAWRLHRPMDDCARGAVGTKRTAPGRPSHRRSPTFSRITKDAAQTGLSATGTRTPGKRSTESASSPESPTRRIVAPLNVITHPTGS
jgi:hypothetical protein